MIKKAILALVGKEVIIKTQSKERKAFLVWLGKSFLANGVEFTLDDIQNIEKNTIYLEDWKCQLQS